MQDKQYRLVKLKYQLMDKKRNGVREVIWKLNRTQAEYIKDVLHYEITPYLYRIQTRRLKNYSSVQSSLLKELHHANKQGKITIVKKLNREQRKVLDEHGISYWTEKYKISLT